MLPISATMSPFLAKMSPSLATLSRFLASMSPVSATMSPFLETLSLVWTGLKALRIARVNEGSHILPATHTFIYYDNVYNYALVLHGHQTLTKNKVKFQSAKKSQEVQKHISRVLL